MADLKTVSCRGSGAAGVETRAAVALAPDLRFTRDRFRAAELVRWLRDPRAVKPDTLMPLVPLTPDEARDIAAFLLTAPLEPAAAKVIPKRLPKLARRVVWDEVYERVFRGTCRHCHAEPDYALGDGGPGNTGGFGFPPRRLNLADYSGVAAGFLDAGGERRSVFAPRPDGTPWLVAALLARQAEEAGRPDPEVRGMPLALPALSSEQIQLVESWIAQGRPRSDACSVGLAGLAAARCTHLIARRSRPRCSSVADRSSGSLRSPR